MAAAAASAANHVTCLDWVGSDGVISDEEFVVITYI